MASDLHYVRMFPLSLVLFPGISIPLHIFEERYKTMVNECIDHNEPFGIILARTSDNFNAVLEPHKVGTLAEIRSVELLEEGRMNIIVEGTRRFRVQDFVEGRPYIAAKVEYLDTIYPPELEQSDLKDKVLALFADYVSKLISLTGQSLDRIELPDDPQIIYSTVASLLAIPFEERQKLLEETDVAKALAREQELLKMQIAWLSGKEARRSDQKTTRFPWENYVPYSSRN